MKFVLAFLAKPLAFYLILTFIPLNASVDSAVLSDSPLVQRAHSLTVGEGFVNPLGFHEPTPLFSWKLPLGVKKQTAYRVEVKCGDRKWDSDWVSSEQSIFVPYGGEPFRSEEQAEWRVKFRDEMGRDSGWSEAARFELGLLSASDWTARWIRPAAALVSKTEPVAILRRQFSITKTIKRARLHVTARGLFLIQLNGERVGRDYFANGFTSYKKRMDTLTYDITSLLRPGSNTVEALLGTGWYAGRFPFEKPNFGPYGRDVALLAQIQLVYADGSVETVATDGSWESTFEGPIVSSSLYDGEVYDERRQPAIWAPVVVENTLGGARLTPKPFAPVRANATLRSLRISTPQPGRYVFDLGQNIVGWARIKIPVEKDGTVTLRFAEMLQDDGNLYTANYRTAKSTDTYTAAKTGEITWEPHFTFHGFRYVELSGLPAGATPQTDWVTGVVLHSDLRTTGTFTSSHAKLNQLYANTSWGWRGNSLDIPTDCPQRDERMGWTGDAQVFCATSLFNTDALAFWKSWLGTMRDDQYRDGAIPSFIPTAMSKWESRSPGWMDAATIIPWELYLRTGDKGALSENYAMMERVVAWYRSKSSGHLLPKLKGIGDWLQPHTQARATPGDRDAERRGDTPLPFLAVAFYARSTQILSDSARVLGRTEDAAQYAAEAIAVRSAFVTEFFQSDGKLRTVPETQTAYVLAIACDLLPPEMKGAAGRHLASLVQEAGGHLRTGFLGTPLLTTALDRTGHADLAAELLFKESYPSWFYSINQGATTIWERWNSYSKEDGFGDATMNSFNHYAYGAICQWLYERVAGLAPDPEHPGYKHFFVRPLFATQLASARAELDTPYGKAVSAWSREGNTITLEISVPPNTTATLLLSELPNTSQTLAEGSHRLQFHSQ